MTNPLSDYLMRRRLVRALENYPIYSPPYTGDTETFCEQEMTANYVFFCENKRSRLEALKSFFIGFSIDLDQGLQSAMQIGKWLHNYGRHGLKRHVPICRALHSFCPDWVGDFRILNLIFDLATFSGELVIAEYSLARWGLLTQESSVGVTDMPGYGQACLFGVADECYGYPVYMQQMVLFCFQGAIRRHRHGLVFSEWDEPDALGRLIGTLSAIHPK